MDSQKSQQSQQSDQSQQGQQQQEQQQQQQNLSQQEQNCDQIEEEEEKQITPQEFFNNKSYVQDYRIMKFIDKGGSGIIKICQKYPDQQTNYIIKIYKHKNNDIDREVNALTQLQHQNIVQLIDYFKDVQYKRKNNKGQFSITAVVLQYCENGCPFEYVKFAGYFEPKITRKLFIDFLMALEYIHSQNLAHRDIKIENLLFDRFFNLYVNDFGYTESFFKYQKQGHFKTRLGTPSYQGPEFYQNKMYQGIPADIFAAGVTLFIMQVGHYPFSTATDKDAFYKALQTNKEAFWKAHLKSLKKNIGDQQAEEALNIQFRDLIENMLRHDPDDRLTIDKIKQHQWVLMQDIEGQQDIASQQYIQNKFGQLKQQVEDDRKKELKRDELDKDQDDDGGDNNQQGQQNQAGYYPVGKNFKSVQSEDDVQLLKDIQAEFNLENKEQKRVLKQAENLMNTSFTIKSQTPEEAIQLVVYSLKKIYGQSDTVQLIIPKEKISTNAYKFQFILVKYNEDDSKSTTELDLKLYEQTNNNNQKSFIFELLRRNGDFIEFIEIFNSLKEFIKEKI